mmetsp:Transcript_26895/g.58347  ORF Transcript_26895/g.58347 Transcript_26895/m.58347 type:complete len:263 (-) Transcript_26895:1857-2645(-)
MPQQHLLAAALHHDGDARDEIGGLLTDRGGLVVEAPLDCAADLGEVGLDAHAEGVDDGAEPVEHDLHVVRRLFLEGVQDAVDEELLEPHVDLRGAEVGDDHVNGLHHHLAVRLTLVLEVLHQPPHNLRAPDLVGQLLGRLHQLRVVALVQRHAPHPEVLEVLGEDVLADVVGLDAVRRHALLDHLEHNLLHLLVGRLELADEDDHDLLGVVLGVLRLHQRDDEPDGLEEGRQHLAALLARALPQGLEHRVEGLDTVRGRRLG